MSGTCAAPGEIAGFVPPTGIIGSGCTPSEVQAYASCAAGAYQANDPGCYNPLTQGAPDGQVNSCGQCFQGTDIVPGLNTAPNWGLETIVFIQPSVGDTADAFPLNFGPEGGVCIYAAGGEEAHACALSAIALDDCVFTVCDNLCAIPNPGSGGLDQTALADFDSCISTAENGACSQYFSQLQSDCGAYIQLGAAELNVYDKCYQLVDQSYNVPQEEVDPGTLTYPEAGAGTATSEAQLLELACGGGDAGF